MSTTSETEKTPDVEVTVSLHPGLAAYLKAWTEGKGMTLGQLIREQIERQEYQDLDELKGPDLIEGIFPGITAETDSWMERNRPKEEKAPQELASTSKLAAAKGESVCMVLDCEAEDVSRAVIISFPSDEDEIIIAGGMQFKLIAPICVTHARIFEAASSKTEVADPITRPEFVS